jgi:hypothetical protein
MNAYKLNEHEIFSTFKDPQSKDKKILQCLHRQCSECNGSGRKKDGQPCVHMISCSCQICIPHFM